MNDEKIKSKFMRGLKCAHCACTRIQFDSRVQSMIVCVCVQVTFVTSYNKRQHFYPIASFNSFLIGPFAQTTKATQNKTIDRKTIRNTSSSNQVINKCKQNGSFACVSYYLFKEKHRYLSIYTNIIWYITHYTREQCFPDCHIRFVNKYINRKSTE